MNKMKKYIVMAELVTVLALLVISCKKDDNEISLPRQFAPATISSKNGETSVTLTWAASLFTIQGDVQYVVEVSKTSTFDVIDATVTTPDLTATFSDDKLAIKQDYYARIKAAAKESTADSKWTVSSTFRITGEQFLNPVTTTNVIDVGVQLTWRLSPTLTKIVVTPATGSAIEVTLDDTDRAAGTKIVPGLTPATNYTAEIFQDTKSKGTTTFKTKASISGTIVDLSGTTGDPNALVTALGTAASGSVIVLRRGETYKYSAYTFSGGKSVSIVSALGYGTNYAILRSSGSFTISASTTIDSIVFKDLIIKGQNVPGVTTPSYDNHYVFNVGNLAATVNKIRFENCTIKLLRGIVRGQGGAVGNPTLTVKNYFINNCLMDSIREYGILSTANNTGATFANVSMTNSTAIHFRKFVDHRVPGNLTMTIANCTFHEVVAGALAAANAVLDYNGVTPGSVSVMNCIFGKTWDETATGTAMFGYRAASGSPTVIGSYSTSDFVNNNLPISGLINYSGSASSLFTDPANDNLKIKDAAFVGRTSAGDPRWRIN